MPPPLTADARMVRSSEPQMAFQLLLGAEVCVQFWASTEEQTHTMAIRQSKDLPQTGRLELRTTLSLGQTCRNFVVREFLLVAIMISFGAECTPDAEGLAKDGMGVSLKWVPWMRSCSRLLVAHNQTRLSFPRP
jgi:hypothetical protein